MSGIGMNDKEMLVTLKMSLKGSRRQIYDNVYKTFKPRIEKDEGHGECYRQIKDRLYRFLETTVEKQLRVRSQWEKLYKKKGDNCQKTGDP